MTNIEFRHRVEHKLHDIIIQKLRVRRRTRKRHNGP